MEREEDFVPGPGLEPGDVLAEPDRAETPARRQKRAGKAAGKRNRPKCCCGAYPWPHRPGGGLCRWPDPPRQAWQGKAGANRPHGLRHRGLVRTICRACGLHPIRDRKRIDELMPVLYVAWCKTRRPAQYAALLAQGRIDPQGGLRIKSRSDA